MAFDNSDRDFHHGALEDIAGFSDAIPDAMVVVDPEGRIRLANRQAELVFGYDRAELFGRPIETLVPEALRVLHRGHRGRYAAEPHVRSMGPGLDLRARRRDGEEFPVEISLGPVHVGDELFTAAVIRDVTRGREEGRLFRGLVEAAPDAMVVVDGSGRIVLVNDHVEELFGYARDELVGRDVEVLIPERLLEPHVGQRAAYLAHPTRRPMGLARDLVARRKDGSEFPVEIALAPVDSEPGTLVTAAVRDISERRRLEKDAELYRAKDEFFATVSHELRTPLTSILGYGELISDLDELPVAGREFLTVMMRNAQRELRLVEDLLTLVHVEESGLSVATQPVVLQDVLAACVRSAEPQAAEVGLTVHLDVPDEPVVVWADEQRLGQAMDNLLSNAIKFTPAGGSVTVRVSHDDDGLNIDVQDTGPGIEEADRGRVFERLYRSSHAVQQQVPGAGLGLAITLAVVEAHSGRLLLHDTSPTGTTMRITLPTGPG